MNIQIIFVFLTSLLTTFLVMPFVIKFAIKIGAVDKPNERKVHQRIMPRIGGLGIFIGVLAGYIAGGLYSQHITGISIGAIIIIAVGILDDLYELSPKIKFLGQLAAAAVVVCTGLKIDIISIPFIGDFELSFWSYIITIFWIISIINAINLIDGLDGLSAGISSISIATIGTMAFIADKSLIFTISIILLGSTLGFLYYNFHPAKIFMGDTGSLFLGYSIAVLSLLGLYKSVTLFSFIVPIIILGVPVFDTSFAIIRRIVNKRPISAPDKSHLHHRLLAQGFSHRQTVLIIYLIGIIFSVSAIIFSTSTLWGSLLILVVLFVAGELVAEIIGLVHDYKYKPILNIYRKVTGKQ